MNVDPNAHPYEGQLCQWFALCDHPATHTRHHTILGDVPICDRCEDRLV